PPTCRRLCEVSTRALLEVGILQNRLMCDSPRSDWSASGGESRRHDAAKGAQRISQHRTNIRNSFYLFISHAPDNQLINISRLTHFEYLFIRLQMFTMVYKQLDKKTGFGVTSINCTSKIKIFYKLINFIK